MKKTLLLLLFFAMGLSVTMAQTKRECAAHTIHEQKMSTDPVYRMNQERLEFRAKSFINNERSQRARSGTLTIPVYVHVIYSNSQENISDSQIQSQIAVLNEDYSATNSEIPNVPSEFSSSVANYDIVFEIVQITRKSSSTTSWGTNDAMKKSSQGGVDPITPDTHLNMWVCEIGGGILGYAQFPGGSSATDGVVMGPQYFGSSDFGSGYYLSAPFDKGRTATHEVGHYLNLRHIWGDGNCNADDFVTDTPTASAANYGCPSYPDKSCNSNGGYASDQFMNYMDYTDDACMYMFTEGQLARTNSVLDPGGSRENLGYLGAGCELAAPSGLAASSIGDNGFTLNWNSVSGAVSYDVSVGGTVNTVSGNSYSASGLSAGTTYTTNVTANCDSGSGASSSNVSVTTTGTTPVNYCSSNGNSVADEYIGRVQIGSINNNTAAGAGGYADHTGISTDLAKDASATITITPTWTGTLYNEGYAVWIDYNQDGDFTDSGEEVWSKTASQTTPVSGSFTVPSSASSGNTRMRVSMKYNGVPTSCESFSYGEVEDYTVNITSGGGGSDTQAPTTPGSLSASNETTSSADVSWSASSDNIGVDHYNVYVNGSLDGTTSSTAYSISGLSASSTYTVAVSAEDAAGNESSTSSISVTTDDISNPGGSTTLVESFFESGWDGWSDGGSDCSRYSGSRSYEGSYSIRIRDNSGTSSAMTSGSFDVSSFDQIVIEFYFYSNSMENNEDFWVRYYNGSSWSTVASYARGTDFNNGGFYSATVTLNKGSFNFPTNAQFRFQNDASGNNDQIYIDQVTITGTSAGARTSGNARPSLERSMTSDDFQFEDWNVYPNPTTNGIANIALTLDETADVNMKVLNMTGATVMTQKWEGVLGTFDQGIDVSNLRNGIYFVHLTTSIEEEPEVIRLMINK